MKMADTDVNGADEGVTSSNSPTLDEPKPEVAKDTGCECEKGGTKMMTPEEITEVKRLFFGEHWRIGTIAAQMWRHPDAIKRAVGVETFHRKGRTVSRKIDPYLEFIESTLEQYPRLRATRIFEMIVPRGYTGSISQLRRVVRELRPLAREEAFSKMRTLPGEQAQVDWGHFGEIQVGSATRKLSAFVMTLSWSRGIHVVFTLDQQMGNFLRSHVEAFEYFGGVPHKILYDNLKSAVLQRQGKAIHFNPNLLSLAGHFHFEPVPVGVARGNEKGRVERAIRFLRDRFFPARHFKNVDDLNAQFHSWRDDWAHQRPCPGNRNITVAEAFLQEQDKLMSLNEQPFPCDTTETIRSGKQPYLRFDCNDYSIPFELIRRPLTVVASNDTVRILNGSEEVVHHQRCWDKQQVIELEEHISALAETKHAARQSKELSVLFASVKGASELLENVVVRGESLAKATRQMERLLDEYGTAEMTEAVSQMLERQVTSPSALAQILEQERRKKRMKPAMKVELSSDPRVKNMRMAPPKLGGYDDLAE
jgi:transposase